MIEYIEYHQIERVNPKYKKYLETTLKAKLSFKEEVQKKDFEDIRKRLKWRKEGDSLRVYFKYVRNMNPHMPWDSYSEHFYDSGKKLFLKEKIRKLELRVKITSVYHFSKEDEIPNLEALNNFILTGK